MGKFVVVGKTVAPFVVTLVTMLIDSMIEVGNLLHARYRRFALLVDVGLNETDSGLQDAFAAVGCFLCGSGMFGQEGFVLEKRRCATLSGAVDHSAEGTAEGLLLTLFEYYLCHRIC